MFRVCVYPSKKTLENDLCSERNETQRWENIGPINQEQKNQDLLPVGLFVCVCTATFRDKPRKHWIPSESYSF